MRRLVLGILAMALAAGCGGPRDRAVNAPEVTRTEPANGRLSGLRTYPRFGDRDPHAWEGRKPWSYPVHGIDVSRYQGEIDWRRVRRSGVSFAYIKATEGGDHTDAMFRDNWRGARAAGLKRGAYHYYYFCRPAAEQARWFIRNVPRDANALPPVLDMEWNHRSRTCRTRPDGAKVRAEARKFLNILERHYGKRPVVYTTVDFYRDTGIGRLSGTEFWLRSVAGHPRKVYPGESWSFWQYSGTGEVPGVAGDVDLNTFRGSPESWLRWSGQI
ncbi:glycoside hydrolase family 25 protein [Leisingera sp. NJS204]|uniref:glycoside hydrolase family 25 protein n=1 Tax=Leisingera sp. NJS204 TaxID=2508307 RepID=UPI001011F6DE|nr:GH25 family lysozyme [Leisingera sp. NJS204]QAX28524.1 glycoside hydrolase [Leisingera sp. NJS204]